MFKYLVIFILINLIDSRTISPRETGDLFKNLIFNKTLYKELIDKRIQKRDSSSFQGIGVIKSLALDKLDIVQTFVSEKNLECMPGSVFYNGSCFYFASKKQRLSWIHAERFCRKLPLNTSFLTIQNDHQYNMLKNHIMTLREKENPSDQLVFYIGFKFVSNEWKWANNQSLKNTNLTLGKYFWDWTGSHGDCGSIALLKNNELVMRSAPCTSMQGRFICQYTLNPCYMNNICGEHGKCVNLYYKSYCDCSVGLFWEGKYCEKLNFAAIQTIIATGITFILVISIFCQTSIFLSIWHELFGKEKYAEDNTDEESYSSERKMPRDDEPESPSVHFGSELPKTKSKYFASISKKVRGFFAKQKEKFLEMNKKEYSAYFLLFVCTIFLTTVQIIIIHGYYQIEQLNGLKKQPQIKYMCNLLEENYLLEEAIYLIPALVFFIVLWIYHRQRRFNKYIMAKFKKYFKTNYYIHLQTLAKEKRKQELEKKFRELESKDCGKCRSGLIRCLRNNFCRVFCCLFCCSFCVPPGSNYRCFLCYCCILGWKQTSCYKIGQAIKKFFYYLFLGCVWKKLYDLTQKQKQKKKEEKKEEIRRKSRTDSIDDYEAELDADEYENSSQEFKRTTFPFPSMPFSSSNRAQSASVYVIYTYDVLNIFVYIYTASISTLNIPYFGRPTGILFDFVIQIVHVLLIGVKFYPILIVADMDPYTIVYLFASIYMSIIWTFKLFTKGFCSRTEAFVKQTLKKLSTEYSEQIKSKIGTRYNISNTVLGLFSDDPNPNEKYLSALKNAVPTVFKEFFGKYDKSDSTNLDLTSLNDDFEVNSFSTLDKYYGADMTPSPIVDFTTTPYSSTLSYGFRDRLKNKTITKAKSFMDMLTERNATSDMAVNILENFPLYLTLSFLLSRYLILFLGCLADYLRDHVIFKTSKKKADNQLSTDIFNKYVDENEIVDFDRKEVQAQIDAYLKSLNYKDENHFTNKMKDLKNHNYYYIQNLLSNVRLVENDNSPEQRHSGFQKNKSRIGRVNKKSIFLTLFQKYIYKSVPYLKYSKQYINTFTVAFMVIYFFTLFGFRLSNLFGNTIVVTIELVYRFIFRGMIPTFNFDDHNFNAEFRLTCLFTSLVCSIQLLLSIKSFHSDLIKMHKGEKLISSLVQKYSDNNYRMKTQEERKKMSTAITSDSLHFPGYLIAHLVYGYALLFIVFFCFTIFFKLLFYFPKLLQISSQVLLPLFILVALKLICIKYATSLIFLREDGQRITNLAPYYTLSYFNFFFDCFLGFVACLSRIWQTTVVSVLTLPRLDTSMFNRDNELMMRRLDKGHVAYINYVRMEHWYNNPVINGFCEMLIESMFYSQMYKFKFEVKAAISLDSNKIAITREVSKNVTNVLHSTLVKNESKKTKNTEAYRRQDSKILKNANPQFQFKSFLRLRNLFYLCLVLKANPSLKKFRHHYLLSIAKKDFKNSSLEESSDISTIIKNKLFKRLKNLKEVKPVGSKATVMTRISQDHRLTATINNNDDSNDDLDENIINSDNFNYISASTLPISRFRRNSN